MTAKQKKDKGYVVSLWDEITTIPLTYQANYTQPNTTQTHPKICTLRSSAMLLFSMKLHTARFAISSNLFSICYQTCQCVQHRIVPKKDGFWLTGPLGNFFQSECCYQVEVIWSSCISHFINAKACFLAFFSLLVFFLPAFYTQQSTLALGRMSPHT